LIVGRRSHATTERNVGGNVVARSDGGEVVNQNVTKIATGVRATGTALEVR
jgi:hypothetical protein